MYRALVLFGILSFAFAGEEDFYSILKVPRSASAAEIKTSFRQLSKAYHPDHNKEAGAAQRFAQISEAYEVLRDEKKRALYDRYGKEGLKRESAGGSHDPFDFFTHFFGGGRHEQEEEKKGPPLVVQLHVSLEDIYNGRELPVTMFKRSTCFHCRGSGADSPEAVITCPLCQGRRVHVQTVQVAPGFVQRVQTVCPKCNGRGKSVGKACRACNGAKLVDDMETFTVTIERGALFGSKVTARNAGNHHVDAAPSDVIFELREASHAFFARRNEADLSATVALSLREALLGFEKRLRHLDGRAVTLSAMGVTQPGSVAVLKGEGLPRANERGQFGDLHIEYRVLLPQTLNARQRERIEEFFKD